MIKLEYGDLSGMKSELQGFRDLSAFRHFEIGVFGELHMAHTVYAMWTVGTSSTSLLRTFLPCGTCLNINNGQPQGWNVPVVVRLQDIKTGVDVRPDLLKQHQG